MHGGVVVRYSLMLAGACLGVATLAMAADGSAATGTVATTPTAAGAVTSPMTANSDAAKTFHDLVSGRCEKCHNSEDWAGGLAMDTLDLNQIGQDPEVWEKAIAKLRSRLMPPAGQPQPDQADVDKSVDFMEATVDAAAKDTKVGHVPIQRLSRAEFAASVKELVGVEVDPKQVLPTEIEVDGFSNVASALVISPSFMEQYLSAARKVAQRAIGDPVPRLQSVFYRGGGGGGGQAGPGSPSQLTHKDGYPLGTRGGVNFTHIFPSDGQYKFNFLEGDSIDAGLYPRGMETKATIVVLVDGKEVARRDVGGPHDLALADRDGPKGRAAVIGEISGVPAEIKEGAHDVTVTFIERSWAESNDATGGGKLTGMPIIRDGVQVVGPYSPDGLSLSASRAKIFVCQPQQPTEEKSCAERIARHLATRAFRRPATDADVQLLMKFYATGRSEAGGFDAGVTELVTAILSSPDFLYRSISSASAPGQSRQLSDLELASRLSFFIWNQGPDEQLISLATKHALSAPAVMDAQVDRMLKDPRAVSLIDNFAFSWLNMGTLSQIEPLDPAFTSLMRNNFETEIRLFLRSILLENHSVTDLLTANYTFVNESLARQYDIPDVYGPQFRQVTLANENRWGLLGKGAVQLRTSYSDRTSPVLRGEYVLDRILGTPPTPPPPGVNTDLSVHEGAPPATVRARLEAHRANPTCKGCHGVMDPYGLAMENFDVTGRWREIDAAAKAPIDATAELTSGAVLHNPSDLRRYLTRRPEQFPTTVTKRLMMYALNRETEYYDMPQVRKIVRDAASTNYSFNAIVKGVVNSDSFRRQAADAPPKVPTQIAANKIASNDVTPKKH